MITTVDNNDLSLSIAQITLEHDLDLIQQSAVNFKEVLARVVTSLKNKDIESVYKDLPELLDYLFVILERTGENYCRSIQRNLPNEQGYYTNKKIVKAKLLLTSLGLSNNILDTSNKDLFELIKASMAEKMEKVVVKKGTSPLENKNWSPGTFKILAGYDKNIINTLTSATSHEDILVKKIIEQSRLFTEDHRYSYIEECCMKYIDAFMPCVKSLETKFYLIGNERNQLLSLQKSHSHLASGDKLGVIYCKLGLSSVPKEKLVNNSLDTRQSDRSKTIDRNYVNDYNI